MKKSIKRGAILLLIQIIPFLLISGCTVIDRLTDQPTPVPALQVIQLSPAGALPDAPLVSISDEPGEDLQFLDPEDGSVSPVFLQTEGDQRVIPLSYYVSADAEGDVWVRVIGGEDNAAWGVPVEITSEGEILRCSNSVVGEFRVSVYGGDQILVSTDRAEGGHQFAILDMRSCEFGETVYTYPDGRINEIMRSASGTLAVWHTSEDGGGAVEIVSADGDHLMTIRNASFPSWSRKGDRLLFIRQVAGEEVRGQIWLLDLAAGELEQILEMDSFLKAASWSPDDAEFAFSDGSHLMIYNFATGEARTLQDGVPFIVWR